MGFLLKIILFGVAVYGLWKTFHRWKGLFDTFVGRSPPSRQAPPPAPPPPQAPANPPPAAAEGAMVFGRQIHARISGLPLGRIGTNDSWAIAKDHQEVPAPDPPAPPLPDCSHLNPTWDGCFTNPPKG